MRLMAVWLRPVAWAMERVDQCVASAALLSSVRAITASTCASVILRGWPGRGSSNNPSTPRERNLSRHLLTVWMWTCICRATARLL
jgi:hypothetical protein